MSEKLSGDQKFTYVLLVALFCSIWWLHSSARDDRQLLRGQVAKWTNETKTVCLEIRREMKRDE